MVRILNGIWNPEAQPFEMQTNGKQSLDLEWSCFGMVETLATAKDRPFENGTI